ncbi:MAG: HEPN domain-containing protein [Acidobacteria bacterium]|nr:HEPN domain-containing protein [Acidobacteriota bacterium]
MKAKADLVRGWVRKAESDMLAMDASFETGAYDAACFHAQQAVEKLLKAFLIHSGLPPIHTHNLARLLDQCTSIDPDFGTLSQAVVPLTPFAVEVRYDDDFWPTREVAEEARLAARKAQAFVLNRLPEPNPSLVRETACQQWRSARDSFDWRVDLSAFKHKGDYPGYFDRVIEPQEVTAFEDQFRSAVESGSPYERAGEVYFWKTIGTPKHSEKTQQLLKHLRPPERWEAFRQALRALSRDPSFGNFEGFRKACGQKGGFATQTCFLAFFDPARFPMADKRIASWWRDYPDRAKRDSPRFCQREDGWIMPCEESWRAYLAWTDYCRRQAESLKARCGLGWRPRDVELAVWVAQRKSIRLECF